MFAQLEGVVRADAVLALIESAEGIANARALAAADGEPARFRLAEEADVRAVAAHAHELIPEDLIARWTGGAGLKPGTVMFGGTLGAIGGIRPADRFEMLLEDRALGRTIQHAYDVVVLPVVS